MKNKNLRIAALTRFALAITVLNLFGHLYLGFETSYAHAFVALFAAYSIELFMETLRAILEKKRPAYLGSVANFVQFLMPAHITGLAVSMLIFPNERLMPMVFAVAIALLSKSILRVSIKGRSRHFLNPSNTGIAISFLLFPWISVTPPYQFTEATTGIMDWVVPMILICLGSFLNAKYTKKIPLILAWLGMFFVQAVVRTAILGTDTIAALGPMTGVAFLLFTFYMVSDPSTTPFKKRDQIVFGASVATVYGFLMAFHIVFGLFFSLLIVCSARGAYHWILGLVAATKLEAPVLQPKLKSALKPARVLSRQQHNPINPH